MKKVKSHFIEDDAVVPADGAQNTAVNADLQKLKDMVAQIVGENPADQEQGLKLAQEAYEGYKEMGMSEEEAIKASENSMKLAKHMGGKKKEGPDAVAAARAQKAGTAGDPAAAAAKAADDKTEETKEAGESVAASVPAINDKGGQKVTVSESDKKAIELAAENAKIKEENRKLKIDSHLDTILRESKLPTHATKAFRSLMDGAKTKEEIDKKFTTFKEAFKSEKTETDEIIEEGAAGANGDVTRGFGIFLEKAVPISSSSGEGGFSSFVEKD